MPKWAWKLSKFSPTVPIWGQVWVKGGINLTQTDIYDSFGLAIGLFIALYFSVIIKKYKNKKIMLQLCNFKIVNDILLEKYYYINNARKEIYNYKIGNNIFNFNQNAIELCTLSNLQ